MAPRTVALLVAASVLAACGGSGSGSGDASTAATPADRPASPAVLAIESPRTGEVIEGSAVDLRVSLERAKIVPQTTTTLVPDEGHLHVILDDRLVSMTEGLEQRIPDVEAGPHRITVEFVASDHAPFDPRVVAVVVFEVAR
jgi:hypothetical protein